EYERENKDYEDWNVWVWNTGAKDDQIDFDDIGDVAIANIEVGPNIKKMGFKLRKGQEWEEIDIDQDREINVSPTENVTKVFVKEAKLTSELFLLQVDRLLMRMKSHFSIETLIFTKRMRWKQLSLFKSK